MILGPSQPRSQARADQRGFAGSRTADNGNEMLLRDLRLEYIKLFLATEKILMIVILERPQSYKRPFRYQQILGKTHDIVPSFETSFARRCHLRPLLEACPVNVGTSLR